MHVGSCNRTLSSLISLVCSCNYYRNGATFCVNSYSGVENGVSSRYNGFILWMGSDKGVVASVAATHEIVPMELHHPSILLM